MILDILSPLPHAPQPLSSVLHQKLLNQILGHSINHPWPFDFTLQNFLINHNRILITEWRISHKHLIDQDPKCPPVHGLVVAFGLDDLRCQVLWRAAQGPSSIRNFLCKPKISDDHMAISVQEDVLRLEVSVGNTERVKVGEGTHNLCRVKQSSGDRKLSCFSEVGKELSTTNVGEKEEEMIIVF